MELSELRKTPHLSASTITTYIDCSLQYYFSRVKRLPMEFVSDALSFGTVIDLVLAEFYRAKMAGDRLSLKEVHELYRQFWTREAKDSSEIRYAEGKDFNTYIMEGVDLLTAWFNKLPDDNFQVVAVEEAFVFEVEGIPAPIIGAIDLVEEDESGTVIITDFKTMQAGCKISSRLVGNQDGHKIYELIKKAIEAAAPPTVKVEVRLITTGGPALLPFDLPEMQAAARAYERG